jgi:hypothetical protein
MHSSSPNPLWNLATVGLARSDIETETDHGLRPLSCPSLLADAIGCPASGKHCVFSSLSWKKRDTSKKILVMEQRLCIVNGI